MADTQEGPVATENAVTFDLATLHELNSDYIRSVQTADVERFREILADPRRPMDARRPAAIRMSGRAGKVDGKRSRRT